ncbi:HNH endonuclease [Roseomonas elaeocarpi]|uniref:HNH endonuclease n=1 Tax=Roseomonas elaeocarpi TaxID=907779 RepID=A0ABV6JZB1_9PROT
MKLRDPFYVSPEWLALRKQALQRDRNTCVVPGCGQRAVVVDHIVSRRRGGADSLTNLRSLCRTHDNQVKEQPGGTRKGGGQMRVQGCDPSGRPLDPDHPWNRGRKATA